MLRIDGSMFSIFSIFLLVQIVDFPCDIVLNIQINGYVCMYKAQHNLQ